MGCPPRHYCKGCGEALVHRDNRKPWESSSGLGQIIWREGPAKMSFADIDGVAYKTLANGKILYRVLEQKQPGSRLGKQQLEILKLMDDMIQLYKKRTQVLHEGSGVFIVRCEVLGETEGRRKAVINKTPFHVTRLTDMKVFRVNDLEHFFDCLDPEDKRRRNR
jgi:hypothetical protein